MTILPITLVTGMTANIYHLLNTCQTRDHQGFFHRAYLSTPAETRWPSPLLRFPMMPLLAMDVWPTQQSQSESPVRNSQKPQAFPYRLHSVQAHIFSLQGDILRSEIISWTSVGEHELRARYVHLISRIAKGTGISISRWRQALGWNVTILSCGQRSMS